MYNRKVMEIIIFIFRIVLILCILHFIMFYNNIDIFDIITQKLVGEPLIKTEEDTNVNIEDDIKELQNTLDILKTAQQ